MITLLAQAEVLEQAGESVNATSNFIQSINWTTPTWDLFIVLFFIIAAFIYGMSLGRDRVIAIMVSVYMALAVVNTAPFIGDPNTQINIGNVFVFRLSTFVGVQVLLFFLLSRSALLATLASSDDKGSWWQVLLFSILHVGLIISIILSFLPASFVDSLSPMTRTFFVSDLARFTWIVAPILAMVMFKGGASHKKKFKYDV